MTPLTDSEKQAQNLIVFEVQNAIDLLHEHFKKYCNEVAPLYNGGQKATNVPMVYISESMKIFKDNYQKGANGDQTDPPTVAEEAEPGEPIQP